MVAINCTRRKRLQATPTANQPLETLATAGGGPMDSLFCNHASHRANRRIEIRTDPDGGIVEVRIGSWRILAANDNRRLSEVRELGCGRVAIRIERFADHAPQPSCEIWQLYDLDGRLDASLQSTPDGRFALLTNYRTRQACRLVANERGEMMPAETWKI